MAEKTITTQSGTEKTITTQTGTEKVNVAPVDWNNNYTYRRMVTIDSDQVIGADYNNFMLMFSGTYSYLADTSNDGKVTDSNGYDIIFTSDQDGETQLDHEIQRYTNTTGECIFWIRVPTVYVATDTVIYMFYGNSAVSTSQENADGAWNTTYEGVWHLQEEATGGLDDFLDSSGNGQHGSGGLGNLTNSPARVTGKTGLGYAQDFDGIRDFIATKDFSITGALLIGAWVNGDTTPSDDATEQMINKNNAFALCWDHTSNDGNTILFAKDGATWYNSKGASPDPVKDEWHYIVGKYTGGILQIMVDGELSNSRSVGARTWNSPAQLVYIGSAPGSSFFNGQMSHVRIMNVNLGNNRVKTGYNNMNSPSTFYSVQSEDIQNAGKTITTQTGTEKTAATQTGTEKEIN
jgi:hypothetical protein